MEAQKQKTVQELSLQFSIQLLNYVTNVLSKESIIHKEQLIRSGTAIGALISAAQGAENRNELFIR